MGVCCGLMAPQSRGGFSDRTEVPQFKAPQIGLGIRFCSEESRMELSVYGASDTGSSEGSSGFLFELGLEIRT